ncbi:tripartite tricarboxylate transporter TctB family protein [Rhodobacteraceae bacterium F11138]|nr:tripartite tricarboxylate transporter TctB family protein [Rhodobacteraceae bacterium F11138]
MSRSDRVSGALVAAAGLWAYLVLIPNGVETVRSAWVQPQAVPNVLAWLLIVLGGVLVFRPTRYPTVSLRQLGRFFAYFALLAGGLYAMSLFGFFQVVPLLGLALMVLMGERRPLVLLVGAAGVPAFIWITVIWLLERSLP